MAAIPNEALTVLARQVLNHLGIKTVGVRKFTITVEVNEPAVVSVERYIFEDVKPIADALKQVPVEQFKVEVKEITLP